MAEPTGLLYSKLSPFRQQNLVSHLLASLHLILCPKSSAGGVDVPSHATIRHDQSDPTRPEIGRTPQIDSGALHEHLIELVSHLPPLLSDGCGWLERGALELIGGRPVDAGGVADVWIGMMGDRKVAIKSYRYCLSSDYLPTYVRFYKEALACSRLKGQTIVPFIGIYSTPEHPSALVFDFMDRMNLREHLKNNRDVGRLGLLLGIARGLEHMHKLNVIHGNLKSTNILIDPEGHARVAGLGVALIQAPMPGVDIDRFFYGAAPELANTQHVGSISTGATKASDVYALAVLFWEVFAGEFPFSDKSKVAAVFSMLKGRRPVRPDHPELSDRLWKTIKKCWDTDPTRRKAITEIVAVLEAEVIMYQPRPRILYQNRS